MDLTEQRKLLPTATWAYVLCRPGALFSLVLDQYSQRTVDGLHLSTSGSSVGRLVRNHSFVAFLSIEDLEPEPLAAWDVENSRVFVVAGWWWLLFLIALLRCNL